MSCGDLLLGLPLFREGLPSELLLRPLDDGSLLLLSDDLLSGLDALDCAPELRRLTRRLLP